MASITETFPTAPRGKRVVYPMIFGAVVGLVGLAVSIGVSWDKLKSHASPPAARVADVATGYAALHPGSTPWASGPDPWKLAAMFLAPTFAVLIATLSFFRERSLTAQFRIEENVLVLGKRREPLAGLTEVGRDPAVMKGACKRWGNGGAGAIRGSFRSKRLGKFYAFLTDTEHAVVLRWADRVVAVSPADPEFFIYSARKAAGLT
jgi:hypothetical protein